LSAAAEGGSQSGYQRLIAAPQCPIAQEGSVWVTAEKALRASLYQKEWSSVTARSNCSWAAGVQETGKWTLPSRSGCPCAAASEVPRSATTIRARGNRPNLIDEDLHPSSRLRGL